MTFAFVSIAGAFVLGVGYFVSNNLGADGGDAVAANDAGTNPVDAASVNEATPAASPETVANATDSNAFWEGGGQPDTSSETTNSSTSEIYASGNSLTNGSNTPANATTGGVANSNITSPTSYDSSMASSTTSGSTPTTSSAGGSMGTSGASSSGGLNTQLAPLPANASWADINEHIEPSCVKISVKMEQGEATGSGFVVGPGLACTNYHVVEGAQEVNLAFANGDTAPVRAYMHLSTAKDIAIVMFDQGKLTTPVAHLQLAGSVPRKGEEVAAFGAPLGLDFTFTQSSVSAVRSIEEMKTMIGIEDASGTWIQHSAPISSGNSGGPLVNKQGQVVAMNTLTLTRGQNLNFAISSGDINQALNEPLTSPLPVSPTSTPFRNPEAQMAASGNPYERGRASWTDLTGEDEALEHIASIKSLKILMITTQDPTRGALVNTIRNSAAGMLERARIKTRTLSGKGDVLLVVSEISPAGNKFVLRLSTSLIKEDGRRLLLLLDESSEVTSLATAAVATGRFPSIVKSDIDKYFTALRGQILRARREHEKAARAAADSK